MKDGNRMFNWCDNYPAITIFLVYLIAVLLGIFVVGPILRCSIVNAAEPQICVLKGTVLDAAGRRISDVFITAICDTNFIKIENHAAWLLGYSHTQTDDFGQWRLSLIAGLTYRLKFVDDWKWRQEYVEKHYYIPFCDSVYFGESDCIK